MSIHFQTGETYITRKRAFVKCVNVADGVAEILDQDFKKYFVCVNNGKKYLEASDEDIVEEYNPNPMKFIEGKQYRTNKGDIAICHKVYDDGSATFKVCGLTYAFNEYGICGDWNIVEIKETKIFDWTKPAQTKGGYKVAGLTLVQGVSTKFNLVGQIEQHSNNLTCWDVNGKHLSGSMGLDLENIPPQKRTVPLEPEDIKPTDLIRHPNDTNVVFYTISGVYKNCVKFGGSTFAISYQALLDSSWEISRDNGTTWEKCEKHEN